MKAIPLEKIASAFVVDTSHYPDAIALKSVAKAGQHAVSELQDLFLHEVDLSVAEEALRSLAAVDAVSERLLFEALWTAALVRCLKCFADNGARGRLKSKKVFDGQPKQVRESLTFLENLRNKHVVHDENPFAFCDVGVVVNAKSASESVADTFCFTAFVPAGWDNVRDLKIIVELTLAWVRMRIQQLQAEVLAMHRKMTRDELFSLPNMEYRAPTADDVSKRRL
jgi:hypothetical protein